MVLSSREARPRRGRGLAATARGTHRKGDAGGLGAQHSARHGTPPSAMPSARRVFPLESYSAVPQTHFDGESECPSAASSATKLLSPTAGVITVVPLTAVVTLHY